MAEAGPSMANAGKAKIQRCLDWLQKQNNQEVKKSLQNKNDIQFIIQMNADRKKFLLSAAEDEASVPAGVDESTPAPKAVCPRRLKVDKLVLTCEWQKCMQVLSNYDEFQKHVEKHCEDTKVFERVDSVEYTCLWDVCGHSTSDFKEIVRHLNYHAYHAKLMAVGYNARATLKLLRCRKDSTKRNHMPPLKGDHCCMWIECDQAFNSIQQFFNHVRQHIMYTEQYMCSWAGCGAAFPRRDQLSVHMTSHTGERQIACYHCGQQFSSNRKLLDHLRRQNVSPASPWRCTMCGLVCATEYLLGEHSRLHVSAFACALCDMSAVTAAALAAHVRYRHLPRSAAPHACRSCDYRAVTKSDLRKHIQTHERKKKRKLKTPKSDSSEHSDDSDQDIGQLGPEKKYATPRKYACHLCPENKLKVFTRGSILTTHLVKVHGAQWPFGYSRFRYQRSEDGMYRLTTTRYEMLDVSEKIVDGQSGPKEALTDLQFTVKQNSEATKSTPARFEVCLKDDSVKSENNANHVEITMCDIDDKGNVIKSEVIVYR